MFARFVWHNGDERLVGREIHDLGLFGPETATAKPGQT